MGDDSDSELGVNDLSESSEDDSEADSEDDSDFQSCPKIGLKQSKTNENKPLYCYHCGLLFPDTKELLQHFAKVYGSSLKTKDNKNKNVEVSCSKIVKVNKKTHSLSQKTDTDTRHLCQICNIAFTKHGATLHRLKEHSDLPKYSQLYSPIQVKKNKVDAAKPKIYEEKANKKLHIQDEVTQVLSDVEDDKKESNIEDSQKKRKQKERNTEDTPNKTRKKRKTDEKKEGNGEKPLILKCSKCGLHFTTAETIDKHFKDCKIKPKDSSTCDVCKLKFTKDELINHLVKHHVTNKYEKFNILAVSNATLIVENKENDSNNNGSTSQKNGNNSDCSENEFEPKINLAISQQNVSVKGDKRKTPIKNVPNKNENLSQTININKTKNNTSANNTKNSNRDLLECFNLTSKPLKICHRRKTYNERITTDIKEVATQTGLCSSSIMEHTSGVTGAEIHTQMKRGSDNTSASNYNRIPNNLLEALNLAPKPVKICCYPKRRKTYNEGITFNIDEMVTQRDLDKNSNIKQTTADVHTEIETVNDSSSSKTCVKMRQSQRVDTQNKKDLTSEEIYTYRETEIDERTQNKRIKNDKSYVDVHLNRAEIINEKIHLQGPLEIDNHENAQCQLEQDAQNARTLISNNTQTEIEICKNIPEEQKQFNLYKCGECNVNFLAQSTCYKHMIDHKPKDPTECSKCSDCGFVFSNYSLGKHKRNHWPKDNIDQVLVEEYRLSMKGEKVAIDVYHIKYDIRSLNIADIESSVSVTEIVNSENIGSFYCDQLNAKASCCEITADKEDEALHLNVSENIKTNVDMHNVSVNTVQTNLGKEKETDVSASEKSELPNAVEDTNGQNLAKETEDKDVANVKTVQTKHGRDKKTDVSDRENTEFQNAVEDENGQNPLTNHKDIRVHPSRSEIIEDNDTVLIEPNHAEDNLILHSIGPNNTVRIEKENKEAEVTIATAPANVFEDKLEQDVMNKKCTGSTIVLENQTKIQNKEFESSKDSEIHETIKATEENNEAPNVRREDETNLNANTSEFHETENAGIIQENSTVMYYENESSMHGDSNIDHNGDIAIIIKTETIIENNGRINDSVRDGNNETVALQIFEKELNSTREESIHDVIEIFESYFEEKNVVTVIDSDDESDCQVIHVEMPTSSMSNRKKNVNQQNKEMPGVTDDNSNLSDAKTMILENYILSQSNSLNTDTSIKMEFDENITEDYLDIKKENFNEELTENAVIQSSDKAFMSENVKKQNKISHRNKRRNKVDMMNYLQISLRQNVNRNAISDSDDDDIIMLP